MKAPKRRKRSESFAAGVGRALRQAAKTARKTARMHGTPIYIVEDGKIVAKSPEISMRYWWVNQIKPTDIR